MKNKWLLFAALNGFFCVAFGAFAAHGLANILTPQALAWIDTGLTYQMFHTLALFGLGVLQYVKNPPNSPGCYITHFIGWAWLGGIICFCGSLYALALIGSKFLVWLTPLGGCLFLIGWGGLIYWTLKKR